jgi:hypothetical protein
VRVGKILISFEHLGRCPKTSQGHMVLSGLQHKGKKSVTTSKTCRGSQALSRCPGDIRCPKTTQGFISHTPHPIHAALPCLEYSRCSTKNLLKISVLISTTTVMNYDAAAGSSNANFSTAL